MAAFFMPSPDVPTAIPFCIPWGIGSPAKYAVNFVGPFRATERDRLLDKKFLVSDYPFASFRYYIDESYQNIKGCETIGCQNRRLSFRKSHCRLWICPCPSFRQNGRGRACGRDCLRNPASAENLKSQDAFGGSVWKIAENTFRKFLRKKLLQTDMKK